MLILDSIRDSGFIFKSKSTAIYRVLGNGAHPLKSGKTYRFRRKNRPIFYYHDGWNNADIYTKKSSLFALNF